MATVLQERSVAAGSVGAMAGGEAAVPARPAGAMPHEYLSFRLGGEEHDIDILRVQEFRGFEAPTRVVGARKSPRAWTSCAA